MKNKCGLCGSTTSQLGGPRSNICLNFSECDARRCAMQEPTPSPNAPESPKETPSDRHTERLRRSSTYGRIMAVVTTVISAGKSLMPAPEPSLSSKAKGSMYGRVGGAQPVPRAFYFYSERPLPGGDAPSLVEEFDDSMRRQRDLTALRDAREKRERKNKKRRGEERS